ncbi:hypothetical protein KIPB_014991, partial [Kipferlia bialata]
CPPVPVPASATVEIPSGPLGSHATDSISLSLSLSMYIYS